MEEHFTQILDRYTIFRINNDFAPVKKLKWKVPTLKTLALMQNLLRT